MAKNWQEQGQGTGRWKLTVTSDTPEDGTPVQVFYGSKDEIADKLADAQGHATRRIAELRRNGHQGANTDPRPLTPAERMQTVADLSNPATVDRGVTRVMESVIGPVEGLLEDRQTREAIAAATSFAEETPDWVPSEYNKTKIVGFMKSQGLSPANRESYTQAFEELSAAGLLQAAPESHDNQTEETAQEPERIAPTHTGPRPPSRISTGVRSADVSGTQPRPINKLKYSREQIANMSAATYKRLMTSDPALARCEDYYAKQPRQKAG